VIRPGVVRNQASPGLIATGHFLRPIGARSMSAWVKSGYSSNFGFESALPQRADMARQPDV
jgi:hypothetical protein